MHAFLLMLRCHTPQGHDRQLMFLHALQCQLCTGNHQREYKEVKNEGRVVTGTSSAAMDVCTMHMQRAYVSLHTEQQALCNVEMDWCNTSVCVEKR